MTTPDVLKYRTDSRHLLAQARSELDAGDLRQASEKGWGAAAQMVKFGHWEACWSDCSSE